ncbi:hypothetical protein FHS18_001159 [Paenibacillus phyllosphaerae]|uniref:Uncharacterized protein n=1 Tax=Paenibacillus phyllosphaerae TaxID=274593 RepID=A0A7W5FLK9_9BACL|nr:hypothetical protein [Paenibacillus phyllosphaerae]
MWLGHEDNVPHGVFDPTHYLEAIYEGTHRYPESKDVVMAEILASLDGVKLNEYVEALIATR